MFKNDIINNRRVHKIIDLPINQGNVAYWMSRDQRVDDNWAFLLSYDIAQEFQSQFFVIFCLIEEFLNAHPRNFLFILSGLLKLCNKLKVLNIPFIILEGPPYYNIPRFIEKRNIKALITDFDPLKIKKNWKDLIAKRIKIPFYEVDTHNIVPCRIASEKQEWAAYTIRPKINNLLLQFLIEIPKIEKFLYNPIESINKESDRSEKILKNRKYKIQKECSPLDWIEAGEDSAINQMHYFINNKLYNYHLNKNNPYLDGVSNLSPYLHFGMISSQRIALNVLKSNVSDQAKQSFLEELIIRKELSDNFCYYNSDYDNFNGFPNWAKSTLNQHRKDKREYTFSLKELEEAKTKDELWNFAQQQLLKTGKMHGYLRMYWAKKILEWTHSPEEAQEYTIILNDRYSLDGRDPNGYTGIAWSIGGVHDRPWKERKIFGKIRYMSYQSQMNKFRNYLEF